MKKEGDADHADDKGEEGKRVGSSGTDKSFSQTGARIEILKEEGVTVTVMGGKGKQRYLVSGAVTERRGA